MTGTIPVRRFATIDSTNLEAQRLASDGTRGPLWVLSDEQSGGRGRLGRNWVSAPGNLYASLLLPIAASAAAVPQVSFVTALAVHDTVAAFCGADTVRLKWPNDLVVADGNGLRKLGGLLVEGGGEAAGSCRAVIGLGLNVRMPPAFAAAIDQPWIDLAGMIAVPPSRSALVGHLLATLLPALDDFEDNGLDPFLPRYAALDALAGRTVEIRDGSRHWNARASGVAADGALRVSGMDGQECRVHAGDVSVRA